MQLQQTLMDCKDTSSLVAASGDIEFLAFSTISGDHRDEEYSSPVGSACSAKPGAPAF